MCVKTYSPLNANAISSVHSYLEGKRTETKNSEIGIHTYSRYVGDCSMDSISFRPTSQTLHGWPIAHEFTP